MLRYVLEEGRFIKISEESSLSQRQAKSIKAIAERALMLFVHFI